MLHTSPFSFSFPTGTGLNLCNGAEPIYQPPRHTSHAFGCISNRPHVPHSTFCTTPTPILVTGTEPTYATGPNRFINPRAILSTLSAMFQAALMFRTAPFAQRPFPSWQLTYTPSISTFSKLSRGYFKKIKSRRKNRIFG